MSHKKVALFGAAATVALFAMQSQTAFAAGETAAGPTAVTEVIVTAQKRQENIQNVGMSIQAASGDKLTKLGITDTASLQKIVPGFEFTPTYYGTIVYTIRGVGFQDTSEAGSPTVSVYVDEMPLPFSILTAGATLDLQRVEVLKGPQGTLFGNNATAGAINYIANKPTDTFQAGTDVTVGNFQTANVNAFVSGPLTDNLDARLALQSNNSGAWQKGYAQQVGQTTGGTDFLNGRLALQWKPNDRFKALLTFNGWEDKGYNQVGQLEGLAGGRNHEMPQLLLDYPIAPHNDQAAGWEDCVNNSPFDPIAGQSLGVQYLVGRFSGPSAEFPNAKAGEVANGLAPTGFTSDPANPGVRAESESADANGNDATVLQGAQPTSCEPMRRNNSFYDVTLRMDYDLGHDMTLTSLTEWERFNRNAAIDGAGVPEQDYQSLQRGKIETEYQELRLSGKWPEGKGNWVVGANIENDDTWDRFLQTYNGSTASPTALPYAELCAATTCTAAENPYGTSGPGTYNATLYPAILENTLGPTEPSDYQYTKTYAGFVSGEYPLLHNLTLLGGVRFTEEDKKGGTCGDDSGDGSWATTASNISNLLEVLNPAGYLATTYAGASAAHPINGYISPIDAYLNGAGKGVNTGPYSCGTTGFAPLFDSLGSVYPTAHLYQHNISWKTGLNWQVEPTTLLYLSISQGYKGGSFPTVAMSSAAQANPVHQENLLAYEVGVKGSWFDHQLTVDGAAFYYDYTDKQILGAETDPIFGPLATLVNVPKSQVVGFELTGTYTPDWLQGLTISPSVSMQQSKILKCAGAASAFGSCVNGQYETPDAYSQVVSITGQSFPSAPEWTASLDAEYDWKIHDDIGAFIGVNVQYTGNTHTEFQDTKFNPNDPAQQPLNYSAALTCGGPVWCYYPDNVPAYTLIDLRAGIEKDNWRLQVWGHNVTNEYYFTASERVNDTILRYTGMPTTYGFTLTYRYH